MASSPIAPLSVSPRGSRSLSHAAGSRRSPFKQIDVHERMVGLETDVARLSRAIDGLHRAFDTMTTEFESVRHNFDRILELRGSLTDGDGNAIDAARLKSDVEKLQQRLRMLDPNLLKEVTRRSRDREE
jgi:hypothetical protein